MTFTPISGQRRLLEQSIKDGGVAGVPTSYYRKALDLNRFSNSVANKLLESYRRQIIKGVRELERIDKMPSSQRPEFKAARTRALIQQNLESMRSWSDQSVDELTRQLDGLADVEVSFAKNELMRAVPAEFKSSVRSVEVTEAFAEAVVKADPLDVGTNLLQQNIEEAVRGSGAAMKLTARQGAIIRMPDGTSVKKAFRGLAERQGELFSRSVLDGLLSGESTASIARSLYGELGFSTEALTPRQVALAQSGNAWKMAKHQVRTLVRTSINATSNAASQAVYKANQDITKKYRWIATLDSRTTAICRNLDQNVYEYGKGPTPASPPHFGCRSTTIPVIDYEGLGIPPPPNTRGHRPTKEANPNSAKAEGGRVPVNISAAQHIYDLRGSTKGGRKSRFEPSAAQSRMLNGGKDTKGGRDKARYFNRLADKYGPDGAMTRFLRQDGSEVSLKELRQRYGEPDKIRKTKPKPKPKPKAKSEAKAPLKPLSSAGFKKAYQGNGKLNLSEVYEQQGFNAKSDLVKDMDQLLARNDLVKDVDGKDNLVFFRGIPQQSSVDQWQGRGSQGGIHYAGKGVYGNGSYMAAAGQSGKYSVEAAHSTARSYAGDTGALVTASGLRKNANVWRTSIPVPKNNPSLDRAANNKARIAARMEAHNEWEKWSLQVVKDAKAKFGEDLNDIGEAAAALGYDGYQVPMANYGRGGSEDYWVILNRNSLVSIEGISPVPATRFNGDNVIFETWTGD
jgi:SPP1 gp7 family putative phage head morphogenesis protein